MVAHPSSLFIKFMNHLIPQNYGKNRQLATAEAGKKQTGENEKVLSVGDVCVYGFVTGRLRAERSCDTAFDGCGFRGVHHPCKAADPVHVFLQ